MINSFDFSGKEFSCFAETILYRRRAPAQSGAGPVSYTHLGHRQLEALNARYAEAKNAEAEARRAYLAAHSAAGASGEPVVAPESCGR